jgi:hypothetical protein
VLGSGIQESEGALSGDRQEQAGVRAEQEDESLAREVQQVGDGRGWRGGLKVLAGGMCGWVY